MKNTTHLIYIAIIIALLVFKSNNPVIQIEDNNVSTVFESDVFYAYIEPNDPTVHIVDEYQPEIEYREIGRIDYPFVKGTNKMLVAINGKTEKHQWIWDMYSFSHMKGHEMESIYRIDVIPDEYQLAVHEHNKAHPEGKGRIGEVIVRGLFSKDQKTKMYSSGLGVDFDQF